MAVICTVRIPHDLEKVQQVEADNAEVMQAIMAAAQKYMTGHRRTARDGEVMDLDEFASREDYDAFIAEAAPSIRRYGELLGAPAQDTVYTVVEGG
ncbi:hypothetical protein [Capillimicrobium parvum]|uniref:Uncharacterized protein n=1 Tax=Capillimicrobium parvum TaxID=2884022 RepID=A0A9E6XZZ0_9ACTN|nr:hypothetical protein [Capillimicrobium parvum]UGS37263.1 hypothetical protein DSM104329_03678 [Capillimicrobium parvum]